MHWDSVPIPPPRPFAISGGDRGDPDDDGSCCALLALSHDELGVIVDDLVDHFCIHLRPRHVALLTIVVSHHVFVDGFHKLLHSTYEPAFVAKISSDKTARPQVLFGRDTDCFRGFQAPLSAPISLDR